MKLKPNSFSTAAAPRVLFDIPGDPRVSDKPSTSGRLYSTSPASAWPRGARCCSSRHVSDHTTHSDVCLSSWTWVLHNTQAVAAGPPAASASLADQPEPPHDGARFDGGNSANGSSGRAGTLTGILRPWRRQLQQLQRCLLQPSLPHGDGDGPQTPCSNAGGSNRMMLLASLTTSALASAAAAAAPGAPAGGRAGGTLSAAADGGRGSGGGGGGGPSSAGPSELRHGFHLPQLSIMRLPGSPSFLEEQDLAQELLDYHITKNGAFPRPCPHCQSADFMAARPGSGGAASGVVEWSSRPLRCETCGTWVHLGCAGVGLVEQVPPRPWFHSRACRDTYLRLEAAAAQNPQPSITSPSSSLYLLTPADMAVYGRSLMAAALGADPSAALPPPSAGGPRSRGPTAAVLALLSQGLDDDAVRGFNEPTREYDGGRYSAVLVHRGQPVAAATFNVFGSEAQICLLATAAQQRRRGHGTGLVTDLEAALAGVGVSRLLVQPRSPLLALWVRRLGYSLVHPEELPDLHRRLPLAYYDCPLLEKRLGQQEEQQQGEEQEQGRGGKW